MSGITNRTVFYDNTNGYARFWDWALVTTGLGAMAEPHCLGTYQHDTAAIQYDPTDMIAMITEIRAADRGKNQLILSGGDHHLNGGPLIPRSGP